MQNKNGPHKTREACIGCLSLLAFRPREDHIHALTEPHAEVCTPVLPHRFLGCGLVTLLDYETWKPRRSLYDPAFTKRYTPTLRIHAIKFSEVSHDFPCINNSYLKGLIPSFNKCVDQFLEKLKPLADGKTQVPMVEEFATLTLDIICKVCVIMCTNSEWVFSLM